MKEATLFPAHGFGTLVVFIIVFICFGLFIYENKKGKQVFSSNAVLALPVPVSIALHVLVKDKKQFWIGSVAK